MVILCLWQYSLKMTALKLDPLSVMMLCGMPNQWMMLETNFTAVSASAFVIVLASIHFVNLSMATNKNLKPL